MALEFLTMSDLAKENADRVKETIRKAQFGPWKWDIDGGQLIHEETGYWVDFERMSSSAELLDWIYQLADKAWVTPEVLYHFIQATNFIVRPQANLCSSGVERGPWKYDPAAFRKE